MYRLNDELEGEYTRISTNLDSWQEEELTTSYNETDFLNENKDFSWEDEDEITAYYYKD
jgi:hypothetical protein